MKLLVVAAATLAFLAPSPAHAQQRSSELEPLVLASQTTWVERGGTFEVRIAAPRQQAAAIADLEYALSVYPSSPSRGAFTASLTTRPTSSPLAVVTTPLTEAPTDERGAVTLAVGVQDPAQPRDRARVALRGAGVYPVAVELRTIGGGGVHARLLTHLVFVPEPPTGPRLAVGVVVPVRAPIALQPSGVDRVSGRDVTAITASARALATLPPTGILLAPAPETLAALVRSGDVGAPALEALRAVAPERVVIPAPFVPTYIGAAGEAERAASRDRGHAITAQALAATPRNDLAVVDDAADDRLTELRERVIIRETALQPASLRFTTAEPVQVRRANTRTTVPALVADTAMGAHLRNQASPVLAAHHLLADLATVYFDSPGRFRSIVVLPSESWRAEATVLGPLMAGLASSPILEAAGPERLFALASRTTVPRTRLLLNASPLGMPGNFAALRRTIDSLRTVMADAPETIQSFDDRLLIAQSTRLSSSDRRRYVNGIARAVTTERRKFQLPSGGSLTLTARRGGIPITVRSSSGYPARVVLQVASDRLKFPGGATRDLVLTRQNTTERFTVQSLGSGAFPLRILLKSPDGNLVLAQTRLTVRSTNASGVGVGLSVGAGLFLVGWWYRHTRRRRIAAP